VRGLRNSGLVVASLIKRVYSSSLVCEEGLLSVNKVFERKQKDRTPDRKKDVILERDVLERISHLLVNKKAETKY